MRPSVLRPPPGGEAPTEPPVSRQPTMDAPGPGPGSPPAGALRTRRWDLFLILAAALLLVGQARLHVFVPGAELVRPALLLVVLACGAWLVQKDRNRSFQRLQDPVSRTVLCLAAWAVVTIPLAAWPGGSARYAVSGFLPTFVVFTVIVLAVRNLEDVRRMVGIAAAGVLSYAILAPAGGRVRGMSAGGYDPNDAAMFLVAGVPLLIFFGLFGRRTLTRAGAWAGAAVLMLALVDTGSRGGFLAFMVVVAFMVFMLRGVNPFLRASVVGVLFLAMIPAGTADYWERMETIAELDDGYGDHDELGGRWAVWERGVGYWKDHPVTGLGINNFVFAEGRHPDIQDRIAAGRGFIYRTAHSQWIQVLAEFGAVGFVLFALVFAHAYRGLRRVQRGIWSVEVPRRWKRRELKVLSGCLLASLVAILVAGSFLTNAYTSLTWALWALVAALMKVIHLHSPRKADPP